MMKKTFQFTLGVLLLFAFCSIYAQQSALSTGKAPFNKAQSHVQYGTFNLADLAYANDNNTSNLVSLPLPAGNPFTIIGSFSGPVFAASMVRGGDLNYYLLDVTPQLYLFDPGSGTCTLIGNITGMGGDQPNGISYNPANDKYYMVSSANFYSLDINTLQATLIGAFTPAITGLMIDLCFDANGTCYSYEVNINAGAANAYNIDITTGALTTIGYLGYTPNYGQGMSYDFENQVIYMSAFNYDTFTGQLRTMDPNTGMTTLVYDWGDQVAPFACETFPIPPCPVDPPSNPNPPNNATDISIAGTTLTWDNGAGTDAVEVWFGPAGNVVQVYSGAPITSFNTGALEYFTTYRWYIRDHLGDCFKQGPSWNFQTEQNPNLLVVDLYPQNAQYWTGNTAGATKTDGEINTVYPNVGWAAFDISSILPGSTVQAVELNAYVNANNWPYWSATPMGSVNPVTADGSTINSQIQASYIQGVAYVYNDESGTVPLGWHTYDLLNAALPDLQAAVNSAQGYFAIGFVDRDFSATYFINFDGWTQSNPPYIEVTYVPIPVELTSFRADVNDGSVVLNWSTATETNNKGFEVQRNSGNGYQVVGFVQGNGTTTEVHNYSFVDKSVASGNYTYRLRQIDFNGKSNYSQEIGVNVDIPKVYSLGQNYPNPFNPSTKIDFNLAADSKVTLKVFNILGQEVTTLLNGNMAAGTHNVTFDASRLSSGVYLYKIEAKGVDGNNFTSIKKMILTK